MLSKRIEIIKKRQRQKKNQINYRERNKERREKMTKKAKK